MIKIINNYQLQQFKQILEEMKSESLQSIANKNETIATNASESGELSNYDNHPADSGTELYDREKDYILMKYANKDLDQIEHALKQIEKGNYGICEVCSQPIMMERLEAIPYATHCVEHSIQSEKHDVANHDNDSFISEHDPNDFFSVAQFGTSETPSDFFQSMDSYNDMYNEKDDE